MSNSLAIAATTATLRHLLDAPVKDIDTDLSTFGYRVTTQPPDLAAKDFEGSNASVGLNIFLYQTVLNAAWRNMDMPKAMRPGETGQPPLALNLHYLLTAYGQNDSGAGNLAQRVLGAALSVVHDHPLLAPDQIANAIPGNDLAKQFERMRITPLPMGVEEISKLWMIFQTQYRLSAAIEVTVALIDSRRPTKTPLPVIRRGSDDRGALAVTGSIPVLNRVIPPQRQSATRLGEDVVVEAEQLTGGSDILRFRHQTTGQVNEITSQTAADSSLKVHLPAVAADADAMHNWTPGYYQLDLLRPGPATTKLVSNALPFALAPRITLSQQVFNAGTFTLAVTCEPRIDPGQAVLLLFGDQQITPNSWANPADNKKPTTMNFEITETATADFVVRLRVDGVDSIPVVYNVNPPLADFDPLQKVKVQ
jgi:hypothetical protein